MKRVKLTTTTTTTTANDSTAPSTPERTTQATVSFSAPPTRVELTYEVPTSAIYAQTDEDSSTTMSAENIARAVETHLALELAAATELPRITPYLKGLKEARIKELQGIVEARRKAMREHEAQLYRRQVVNEHPDEVPSFKRNLLPELRMVDIINDGLQIMSDLLSSDTKTVTTPSRKRPRPN